MKLIKIKVYNTQEILYLQYKTKNWKSYHSSLSGSTNFFLVLQTFHENFLCLNTFHLLFYSKLHFVL